MNSFEMPFLHHAIPVEELIDEVRLREELTGYKAHYTYLLCRPNGVPFYAGKGQGSRVFCHLRDALNTIERTHKLNVIRKIKKAKEQIGYWIEKHPTHEIAIEREIELIRSIGRYDLGNGPLTNQTDGGEGTLNLSAESKAKHRETLAGTNTSSDDRNTANALFAELVSVGSVPIKPTTGRYKIDRLFRNRKTFSFTERMSGALVASAMSNKCLIEENAIIPRRFHANGVEMIIENGCGRDMLSSGTVVLEDDTPKYETLKLKASAVEFCKKHLGSATLVSAGVLLEEIE